MTMKRENWLPIEDYESEFIDFAEKTFKKITKKLKTSPGK